MRVEILYDFDFQAFHYYRNGLNEHPSYQFRSSNETVYPLKVIQEWSSITPLYLLSGGLDKICLIESGGNSSLVIEPCSAIFFICEMENNFVFLLEEISKGKSIIDNCGITISQNIFRANSHRSVDELEVHIQFEKEPNGWYITFSKIPPKKKFRVPLSIFLSSYFDFCERMVRFYDHVLPEYKNFSFQYPLFIRAVRDSAIMKAFEIKPQSSYDKFTYYDYQ
jgi:hypothetical protein